MSRAALSNTRELARAELPTTQKFTFRTGEESQDYTYQQAFALGHSFLKSKKFALAVAIFEKLAMVTDRGPRAHILLAIANAGLSNYKGARHVLDCAFHGELAVLAAEIHDVIVESRMGFKEDSLRELVELVNGHKELPTLCLWLGDLLENNQQISKATQCWKLAIKRDHPGGAVALAAQQQLKRFADAK